MYSRYWCWFQNEQNCSEWTAFDCKKRSLDPIIISAGVYDKNEAYEIQIDFYHKLNCIKLFTLHEYTRIEASST